MLNIIPPICSIRFALPHYHLLPILFNHASHPGNSLSWRLSKLSSITHLIPETKHRLPSIYARPSTVIHCFSVSVAFHSPKSQSFPNILTYAAAPSCQSHIYTLPYVLPEAPPSETPSCIFYLFLQIFLLGKGVGLKYLVNVFVDPQRVVNYIIVALYDGMHPSQPILTAQNDMN